MTQGVLTLPNGDYIEGQFNGSFSDGIKVNGMFHKSAVDHAADQRMMYSVNSLTFPKYGPHFQWCTDCKIIILGTRELVVNVSVCVCSFIFIMI